MGNNGEKATCIFTTSPYLYTIILVNRVFSRGAENKLIYVNKNVDINFYLNYINYVVNYEDNMNKNNIKHYRVKNRLTQWKLANQIGMTASMVSIWENGYMTPTEAHQEDIAAVFGVSVSTVFPMKKEEEF